MIRYELEKGLFNGTIAVADFLRRGMPNTKSIWVLRLRMMARVSFRMCTGPAVRSAISHRMRLGTCTRRNSPNTSQRAA